MLKLSMVNAEDKWKNVEYCWRKKEKMSQEKMGIMTPKNDKTKKKKKKTLNMGITTFVWRTPLHIGRTTSKMKRMLTAFWPFVVP